MKKNKLVYLLVLLAAVALFAACGKHEDPAAQAESTVIVRSIEIDGITIDIGEGAADMTDEEVQQFVADMVAQGDPAPGYLIAETEYSDGEGNVPVDIYAYS